VQALGKNNLEFFLKIILKHLKTSRLKPKKNLNFFQNNRVCYFTVVKKTRNLVLTTQLSLPFHVSNEGENAGTS
jgi:hypothetical protein